MTNQHYLNAKSHFDDLVLFRRNFHQYPEIGFKEFKSAEIIANELRKFDYTVKTGIADTGITGTIGFGKPVVMLRFDMDGLPINEENLHDYRSKHDGIMHACGHDGHMAVGLITARLLAKEITSHPGTIKLVFQPAEEGLGGAGKMVNEGVLEKPHPDFCLGMHIWNDRPLGWIGITPGPIMAGSDFFQIKIQGIGGHGAIPHQSKDVVIASSMIIQALQTIISRNIAPLQSGVISVTAINTGEAFNVIPSEAVLKGTIRYFSEDVHQLINNRIIEIVTGVAVALGCKASVEITDITPPLINDQELTRNIYEIIEGMSLFEQIDQNYQTMGSEDMALFQQRIPGCYLFFGSGNASKGFIYGHHHPKFDFDEEVLSLCVATMTSCSVRLLETSSVL